MRKVSRYKRAVLALLSLLITILFWDTLSSNIMHVLPLGEESIQIEVDDSAGVSPRVYIVRTDNPGDLFDTIVSTVEQESGWSYLPIKDHPGQAFDMVVRHAADGKDLNFKSGLTPDKEITFWVTGTGNKVTIKSASFTKTIEMSTDLAGGELVSIQPFEGNFKIVAARIILFAALFLALYRILAIINWEKAARLLKDDNRLRGLREHPDRVNYVFCGLLCVIFFSITPILTFDSVWYHVYFPIFNGDAPLTSWDPTRGFAFPLLLYWATEMFGYTTQGLQILLFLFYGILVICTFTCFRMIFPKTDSHRLAMWLLLTATIFLNPIVVGYYHCVLTEFLICSLIMLAIITAGKTFQGLSCGELSYKQYWIRRFLFVPITGTLAYFIKQPFIVVIILPFFITEIFGTIFEKAVAARYKRIAALFGYVLLTVLAVLLINSAWNTAIDIENARTIVGTPITTSSVLSNSIVKGLRYFEVEENGDTVQMTSIHEDKEERTCKFQVGENSILRSLQILFEAIRLDFGNVIQGYFDNYLAIANIYYFPNQADRSVLSKKISFTRGAENSIIGLSPKSWERGTKVYVKGRYFFDELVPQVTQYEQSTDTNRFIKILYNNSYIKIANFLYSTLICLSLPLFIGSAVMTIRNKGKMLTTFIAVVSGSAFMYTVFLACMGMTIDRYAVIWYIPLIISVEMLFIKLLHQIYISSTRHCTDSTPS